MYICAQICHEPVRLGNIGLSDGGMIKGRGDRGTGGLHLPWFVWLVGGVLVLVGGVLWFVGGVLWLVGWVP